MDCARSNLENNNTFKLFTMVESIYILVGVLSSILNDICGETFEFGFLAKPLGPAASDKRQKLFSILYDSLTVRENRYVLASEEPLQQPFFLLRLQH